MKSVQIRCMFWSVFSRIRTEYGEIRSISPYSARMWENTDQNNSQYGHFLRSVFALLLTPLRFSLMYDIHSPKIVTPPVMINQRKTTPPVIIN